MGCGLWAALESARSPVGRRLPAFLPLPRLARCAHRSRPVAPVLGICTKTAVHVLEGQPFADCSISTKAEAVRAAAVLANASGCTKSMLFLPMLGAPCPAAMREYKRNQRTVGGREKGPKVERSLLASMQTVMDSVCTFVDDARYARQQQHTSSVLAALQSRHDRGVKSAEGDKADIWRRQWCWIALMAWLFFLFGSPSRSRPLRQCQSAQLYAVLRRSSFSQRHQTRTATHKRVEGSALASRLCFPSCFPPLSSPLLPSFTSLCFSPHSRTCFLSSFVPATCSLVFTV